MPSASGTTFAIDLTAIVLSASKQTVSGKTVNFSTIPGETAFISPSPPLVSDKNGFVTAKLFLGTDRSNRAITVTATADSATTTSNIDVTGTSINLSGVNALAFGTSAPFTFTLKDSSENPIAGVALSVTSTKGNTITPASSVTDSRGQVTATVTATAAGDDVITATAAGARKTQALSVSSDSFAFTLPAAPVAPATTIDIPLNTATNVSVNWKQTGAPVSGNVTFAATRGTITGTPIATDPATGSTPVVTISSNSSGPAIISATGQSGTPAATINVVFVARTASNVTGQAVPGTIQHTTGVASQTSNAATISAVVRDGSQNLVKDALVNFNITQDPTGGALSATSVKTDIYGTASVIYTAGNTSSAQNGVTISATAISIAGVPLVPTVTGITTLSVSGQSVLVRLGSDNLAASNSPASPTYSKTFAAIVTDTSGNPVVGTAVHFALRPGQYRKGSHTRVITGSGPSGYWDPGPVTVSCPNEDRDFDGFLKVPPDIENQAPGTPGNGYGSLQPGMPASVNLTGTTDDKGVAVAIITYPKNHGFWTEVTLEARTGVTSNDPPAYTTFVLPVLSIDFSDVKVFPPGKDSPWGVGSSCADLL